MASDLSQLESRYCNACQKQEVLPNSSILSCLSKAFGNNSYVQAAFFLSLDMVTYSKYPFPDLRLVCLHLDISYGELLLILFTSLLKPLAAGLLLVNWGNLNCIMELLFGV